MQYCTRFWKANNKQLKDTLDVTCAIVSNINRQKKLINNNKKYSETEKKLIIKGLNIAIDRVWGIYREKDLI